MNRDLLKHRDLLRLEYECEREMFRRETRTMGVGRKVKRGMCWFPVQLGRGYYSSLNQYVIELTRTEDLEIEPLFEYGKPVCFFYEDGTAQIRYLAVIGQVSYVDGDRMVVALPGQDAVAALQDKGRLGVQLYFDEQTYKLMFAALDEVIEARSGRLAELRDMFHGTTPVGRLQMAPVRFPWLNSTQERAVNEILCAKDVAVVHGPPGTGKTTTLVEAVYEVLRRENQVLVCAQSNMAVDWICEQLVERNISVLRIGNPSRVNDKMLSFTYERAFAAHADYPELWAVRRSIRQLYAASKEKRSERFHQQVSRLKDRAAELELRIRESLFRGARVVASTLAGAGNALLYGRHYHTLFIDEAAQALEAACWIAIRRADRVILAGDHQQLPPTVKCIEAERKGLAKTLMETIVENKPKAVTLLETQYRMTEPLMRFSSEWFYEGKIKCAANAGGRSILELEKPITWVDTSGMEAPERFVGESYGRVNDVEAALAIDTLLDFIGKAGAQRLLDEGCDFGIISPYKAQVQQLWRLIRKERRLRPFRHLIAVGTVDGFQGRERDVVIISLVRSNKEAQIGFLSDLRRMNVAMTRARMKLIIIGNARMLSKHKFYKALYEYVETL